MNGLYLAALLMACSNTKLNHKPDPNCNSNPNRRLHIAESFQQPRLMPLKHWDRYSITQSYDTATVPQMVEVIWPQLLCSYAFGHFSLSLELAALDELRSQISFAETRSDH